jgi:hypothetical protein
MAQASRAGRSNVHAASLSLTSHLSPPLDVHTLRHTSIPPSSQKSGGTSSRAPSGTMAAAACGRSGPSGNASSHPHLALHISPSHKAALALATASAQPQHEMNGRLLLNVVVPDRLGVVQLLAVKDEPLLLGRDPLLVLDLGLDLRMKPGDRQSWSKKAEDGAASPRRTRATGAHPQSSPTPPPPHSQSCPRGS